MQQEPWHPGTDENIDKMLAKLYARLRKHRDTDDELMHLTLYKQPLDAPEMHVVRAWFVRRGYEPFLGPGFGFREEGVAELWIAQCFPWMTRVERAIGDHPTVVAVWI